MWEFLKTQGELHGPVFLICLLALGAMGVAVWRLWKRHGEDIKTITELSERLAKSGNAATLKERHDELVGLLKKLRFAYSGDGDVMKKLNEILDLEKQLFDAHLGPGAKDEEGRLKWWGAGRLEEVLDEVVAGYEQRIAALQELRLQEAHKAGDRIDTLQEKRVSEAHEMVRESIVILKDVKTMIERIKEVMEDLRSAFRGGVK